MDKSKIQMKIRISLLFAALVSLSAEVSAQPNLNEERIGAAFVLVLGRAPSAGELNSWNKTEQLSMSDLISGLQQQLQNDPGAKRATLTKACEDAFGREPRDTEINVRSGDNRTYTELMKEHVHWLTEHQADYERVIERAYQRVLHRSAYPGEIVYWRKHDTLPYSLLAASVNHWARRNAPGLMETGGLTAVSMNDNYLTTIRLSPEVATEARAAIGLAHVGDAALADAAGHNLVAVGAENIVTDGHINFAAAGGPGLLSDRAGS